jgi:peptidoglycan/LPS O-acetylase OafA/YrhL
LTTAATHTATAAGNTRPPGTGFRPDIQGLRAIAVLTVIAGHAGLALHGGFVGVDVFFVISGFLISSLLFREASATGSVSLTGFYARRARRILPAATLVTLVTLAASALWLSLVESLQVTRDALWVTLFAANIHFSAIGTDYFSQDQPPSPLQHYWSLSVEEQFYLVWPLVLIGALVVTRRLGSRRVVLGVLLAITGASLIYSVLRTPAAPTAAYFSTPARAWELGVGALTALAAPRIGPMMTRRAVSLMSVAGLAAIAYACVTFDSHTLFPGYAAILPVVGSAAVLLAGSRPPTGPQVAPLRALAVRPLRVVGDWSYSLYLWHWPVLQVAEQHAGHRLSPVETAAALLLIFVLAGLTYRFVETPFRDGRRFTVPRAITLYPVSLALVAVSVFGGHQLTVWQAGNGAHPAITTSDFGVRNPARYPLSDDPRIALVQASVIAARHGMAVPSDLDPTLLDLRNDVPDISDCDYSQGSTELCPRGDPGAARTIVVVGDSHGRMWIPAIDRLGEENGWKAYYFVKPHCTAVPVAIDEAGDGRRWDECTAFHEWTLQQIASLHPDLVVVSTAMFNRTLFDGDTPVTDNDTIMQMTKTGFAQLFESLEPLAKRVVLVRDVPMDPADPVTCLTSGEPDLGDCLFTPEARSRAIADLSVEAAQETGTPYVDPTSWICWDGSCPAVVGSTPTYRDHDHLTQTYAGMLADHLGPALGLTTASASSR